jgi:hypothetical protein
MKSRVVSDVSVGISWAHPGQATKIHALRDAAAQIGVVLL